jgi:hypothetical protein
MNILGEVKELPDGLYIRWKNFKSLTSVPILRKYTIGMVSSSFSQIVQKLKGRNKSLHKRG